LHRSKPSFIQKGIIMTSLLRNSCIVVSLSLLAACSSTPLKEPTTNVTDQSSNLPTGPSSTGVVPVIANDKDELAGPALAKRSVYFDYDSYIVKDDYKSVVEVHARYIQSHKTRKVVIQGNADERGGAEYNLALGQKRAEAVRRAMTVLGVPDSQLEAVSFGKEKPKAVGHDEAAWAENRRADIVYQ
jgi:peptidoglycan-associated lipoprotein